MKRIFRDNGLSIVVFALFLVFLGGQSVAGYRHYNDERGQHGESPVSYSAYLRSGDFLEATTENWESEFLQMGAYVIVTALLFQRGSAESKKIGEPEPVDRDPRRARHKRDVPAPVRRGGLALRLYEHSLGLAFVALSWSPSCSMPSAARGYTTRSSSRTAEDPSAHWSTS
jgi:hypothetical protein